METLADRIEALEAENARMKAQLDLIEEVGIDEIEAAIGLRQALAQERVEGDQLREVLAAVDTKLAEVFERWHWAQGPDADEAVQTVEAIRNLIPREVAKGGA